MEDHDINTLRIQLIGNKDLKYKLVSDQKFLADLIQGLNINDQHLRDKLIILRFLLKFDQQCLDEPLKYGLNRVLTEIVDDFISKLIRLPQEYKNEDANSTGYDTTIMRITLDLINQLQTSNPILSKLVLVLLQINEVKLLENCLNVLNLITINDNVLFNLLKRLKYEIKPKTNLKLIYKLILNLNYYLTDETIQEIGISLDKEDIDNLVNLIKQDNKVLNLNILNLMYLLKFDINLNKLVELLEFNDYSINSFKILSLKIMKDDSLVGELAKIKIDENVTSYILKMNIKLTKDFNLNQLFHTNFKDILLLISLLTSTDEDFRLSFANSKFNFRSLLFNIINAYKTLLVKFTSLDPKLIPILTDELFTNTLYLIRSLSRSISLLRTFFIDCHLTDNLIEILKLLEIFKLSTVNKTLVMAILANLILDFTSFRYNLISNSDFFSNLLLVYNNTMRSEHTQAIDGDTDVCNEKIKLHFLQIIKNLMFNENEDKKIKLIKQYFNLNIFLPYLNYDHRQHHHGIKLQQKIISFDIFRNLSSNSNYFNKQLSMIVGNDLNIEWDKFLIKNITNLELFDPELTKFNKINILKSMENTDYVSLILSINYIENHKFLSINSIHLNHQLLKIWLNFLKLPIHKKSDNKIKTNVNSIKLSVIWILINLTWQNNLFDVKLYDSVPEPDDVHDQYNDIEPITTEDDVTETSLRLENTQDLSDHIKRATFLKKFGFIRVLKTLQVQLKSDLGDSLVNDMLEKIKTVLYHFDNILNPNTISQDAPQVQSQVEASEEEYSPFQPFGFDDSEYNTSDDDYWIR